MQIQRLRGFAWGLVLAGATGFPASLAAQSAPVAEPPPSLFHQVIPQPSGKNGYELLVLAADAFQASKLYEKAQEPGTSLAFKRQVLADRQVAQALKLLRDGVETPVFSPRVTPSFSTPDPELAQFWSLARLLALQQYVFLADGRTADALANARLGLRFSMAVQTDTLVSGLTGAALGTVCLGPLARHLDQLSVGDCASLYQICLEWLAQPDPQIRMLAAERRVTMNALEELKNELKQKGAAGLIGQFGLNPDNGDLVAALQGLPAAPEGIDALFADVGKRLDERFDQAMKALQKPRDERGVVPAGETDPAGKLAAALAPPFQKVDDQYTRAAARIRLLACHCAIHRYRWEYDRLPSNLTSLSLDDLAIDPFTGQPLQYAVHGSRYTLTSAGAPADPNDPRTVNGRQPVSVTPGD